MKRFVGAALAAVALMAVAGEANARCFDTNGSAPGGIRCRGGFDRGGRTTVIQGGSGVDINQLLLLQALGGGALGAGTGGLGALALPLLLNQQNETTVVESRGRRRY